MSAPLRIEVVRTLARFEELRQPWNALADRHPTPLLRHEWFAAAARAFSPGAPLAVVLAWRGDRLAAAAPLVQHRDGAVVRLRILGFQSDEPESFLYEDEAALGEVCQAVTRLGRPVVLRRLGARSPELTLLQEAHRGRGLALARPDSTQTLWNPIAGSWAEFETAMPTKKRNELRRRRANLEQLGRLEFEALAPDPDTVDAAFEAFVAVEGTGWKTRMGTALTQDAPQRSFLLDFCRQAAAAGFLRLFFLRLDGTIIAGQLHVQHSGRVWALKIGFDERLAKHSVGVLLTHDVLRYACEQGLQGFEHLGVAEAWQRRWPAEVREHTTLRLYPVTPGAAVAFTADTIDFVQRRRRAKARQAGAASESAEKAA